MPEGEDGRGPRRPDYLIAAIGRSGSTMLADWLTTPPSHYVLHEPKLGSARRTRLLVMQLEAWGRLLEDVQAGHWAVKEIETHQSRIFVREWSPPRVVFCVRNIRDVAFSLFEKHRRQGNLDSYPDSWTEDYCLREAAQLVEHAEELERSGISVRVTRYEDFSRSGQERSAVAEFVGWPGGGGGGDAMLQAIDRGFEAERHGRSISPGLASGDSRGLDPQLVLRASRIAEQSSAYQQRFGYR